MRVCLITGEFPPMEGGVGDYSALLGREFSSLGVEVSVVTSKRATGSGVAHGGLRVHAMMEGWSFRSLWQAARTLYQEDADIAHIQYQTAAFGMRPAINLLPAMLSHLPRAAKAVTTFHDLRVPYLFPKAGRLRGAVNELLMRSSAAAVLTNPEDYQEALGLLGGLGGKGRPRLALIPIGNSIPPVPPQGFEREAWRRKLAIPLEAFLVGYFGFLNSSKGVEELLRALARLVGEGVPARLLMVGGSTGSSDPTNFLYRRHVERLIADLGLERFVRWTGFCAAREAAAHLACLDACALPFRDGASYRRGTLMTALALGLPLVTTRPRAASSGDFSEEERLPDLEDGENCLLVPAGDDAALAQALLRLYREPALRERIGNGARALSSVFAWPRIAQAHLRLYREVLGKTSGTT